MKNLVCLIVVLALAATAFAAGEDVVFDACDIGSGQLQISYTTNDPCAPRGIALLIDADAGNGTAEIVSDACAISVDSAFNTYIDYAFGVVDPCDPCSYQPGDGHPLANPAAAGVPSLPAQEFSLCMGVLDPCGNQAGGPASTSNLITLQLESGDPCVLVTISADTLRAPDSGAVGSSLTTNLPIEVWMEIGDTDCVNSGASWHSDWLDPCPGYSQFQKPSCWCYPRQCRGDATGTQDGGLWVQSLDLGILRDAFGDTDASLASSGIAPNNICADFNHHRDGGLRVQSLDLNVLRGYFGDTEVPCCDADQDCVLEGTEDYNFFTSP
jgi:hypothetical protein